MFRISIAGILWLIVLAALNFAVLRYFEYLNQGDPEPIVWLVGLMPLFDVFLISFYAVLTKQYRFALMRRAGRGGFAKTFAVTTGVMFAFCMFVCFAAPQGISNLLNGLCALDGWFDYLRQQGNAEPVLGATLCLIMSGPLLVIATVFSFAMSRYRLVITRRLQDAPAVDSRP
jgi:hypothetical protein